MKNNSYGISIDVWFVGVSNFILSSIVPHSCWLFSVCCAKAEWGSMFLIYLMCS